MNAPTCEKCGSDDVLTRWHGEGFYHSSRNHTACWSKFDLGGAGEHEHLHYHCRTCQFEWTGPLTPGVGPAGDAGQ